MENLLKPEIELSAFFEMTPDLVCLAGKDGFFRKINLAVIDKLGYTKEELFAAPIASFIHPEDKEITHQTRQEMLQGKPLRNFNNRYVTKSGNVVWLEWTSIYFADSELVFAIAKDVTERKLIEKEVDEKYNKFKSLATHFKKRIEKDKKNFAYELHEELAQLVSVIKMDIDWIANAMTNLPEPLKNRIDHASVVSRMLIKSIQRISFSISPGMMDDLGFNTTLEWLCNEFGLLNGFPCKFENYYDEEKLTPELKTDLFRICQESLTNVTYHAQANNVIIRIEELSGKIVLTITDDGKGFDINEEKETPGITNMHERAASINGLLTVESKIGKGTTITFSVEKPKIP
ncbi:PAS domain-containing sensor histidine kinase [Ferruginibacter sp. SUN106]|uniref:PAS domain-containing sensor histidine kinase n=1 Tax=Ferruginibacter sp. SUN106 TaxID=2978348 RepID=UPI003D35F5BE